MRHLCVTFPHDLKHAFHVAKLFVAVHFDLADPLVALVDRDHYGKCGGLMLKWNLSKKKNQ